MKKTMIFVLLCGIFLTLFFLKNDPRIADAYVRYVSTNYARIVGVLFSWIPFSFYELFLFSLFLLLLLFLWRIAKSLFTKKWNQSLRFFVDLLLIAFFCLDWYFAVASMSYWRSPVPVPAYEKEVSREFIDASVAYYLDDYNRIASGLTYGESGFARSPYSFEELNEKIGESYAKLDDSYFNPHTGRVKKLLFSPLFSEMQITGVTFAPLGEIAVNADCPPSELPHVMAHEIAHSKGVYREDDANLVALYVLLSSDDDYLRYAGYYAGFSSLLSIYALTDYQYYESTYLSLNEAIRKEYGAGNDFWRKHDILAKFSDFINDFYLRINGSDKGTDDYIDSSEHVDSGETDSSGRPIYVIEEYSPYQKLFFALYDEQTGG